ncbi:MAG: type I DNA topoisomerase [Candidatus Pacebacteria bacterium]|nr:type I DNA topoisomerase [Candidatus Paceibacterota bacterium]
MKLLIVESPSKAKTIEKYLEGAYTVRASVGHIRDLPKSNKDAIDIPGGFIPHYEISPGKEKVVSELKSLANKVEDVLLATDPDREGEAIAWHIKEAIGLKNPKRVCFYEITKDAIKEAIKNPRQIDEDLRKAQEARRVLDRLVGYDLSGLIWKKVRYGLSAGRVQSPALRIIMEREREIRAFKPEQFWTIEADTKTKDEIKITLGCDKEPRDIKEVEKILDTAKKETWSIKSVTETEAKRSPKAPFTTSTLQQTASTRLGFAPSKTMMAAQKLYEAGFITYMRTDSTNLSTTALDQIGVLVSKKYGDNYAKRNVYVTKSKNAQEAHEAVRPTDVNKETAGLTDEQRELYRLIWQRTVACQMSDAKILRSKITAIVGTGEIPTFSINGSRMLFDGWLKADPEARGEDVELPKVKEGDLLDLLDIRSHEKFTEPPGRYTEAGLIKELEKRGIGRPSTYASIMKTIETRGYVEKQNKTLFPTDTGEVVSDFLETNFAEYISDTFTADMEDKLDDISNGKREYEKTLKDFYGPFLKDVKAKGGIEKVTNLGEADPSIKCPKCDGPMVIKLSKSGKFLSCKNFPECVGARKITGEELEGPKETGEMCPECKVGKLVERDGRFGRFIACANYPKCKYIKKGEGAPVNTTGVKCPMCKTGEMAERRGRFGTFFSCTNYPKCKNITKTKPTGNLCPTCGALMMLGTKTIPERCSNKECVMHNPHKLEK